MAQSNALIDYDTLDLIAKLVWAHSGDAEMAERVMLAKVVGDMWQRLSGEQEIEALRTEAILRISKFVKENPRASKEVLTQEIGKHITEFAKKVENL